MLKIEAIGQIWNSLTNGFCYSVEGLCPCICLGAHGGCEPKIIYSEETNMEKTKLNRYVRYIYRKLMTKYGAQKVREEALNLYVLTTMERDNARPSDQFTNAVLDLLIKWDICPKMIPEGDTIYQDLAPIRVRIRKLTPREAFRLMDVRDYDIDKMMNANISNSRLYALAGNSIVCACLMGIFTQLFRADSDSLF